MLDPALPTENVVDARGHFVPLVMVSKSVILKKKIWTLLHIRVIIKNNLSVSVCGSDTKIKYETTDEEWGIVIDLNGKRTGEEKYCESC